MKPINFVMIAIAALAIAGCSSGRLKPAEKITYSPKGDRHYSLFIHTGSSGTPRSQVSIGDSLFEVIRFSIKDNGTPFIQNPWRDPYPSTSSGLWYSAHTFTENGKTYRVYTHDKFYEASTGIILDNTLRIPFYKAFVKLKGATSGKRWKTVDYEEVGKFFFSDVKISEKWGIRYAGREGNLYVFETYNKPDASVSTITQSIKITEAAFMDGFIVRGVKITGKSTDSGGVINFTYTEKFKENLDSDDEWVKGFAKTYL